MDYALLGSFPKACLGGNSWKRENLKKICFPGSYTAVRVSGCRESNILQSYYAVGLRPQHPQQCLKHKNLAMKGNSISNRTYKKFLVNATAGHPLDSEPGAYNAINVFKNIKNAADAFYRFSRPHTVIGTTLGIISVSLLAVQNLSDFSPLFFTGVLQALLAAHLMNIYVVGLNQLTDIDIDKINKPFLPLASGEYSVATGIKIVTSFVILSFSLGWIVGSWPLFWAIFIWFVLGTAYSLNVPLLRWKRSPVVAAMCILTVRGVIIQLAFFLHMQTQVFKRPAAFSKPVIFATTFMSFFAIVIALFKDIPDIDGDKIFDIQSFTVRLGQKRVFWTCIWLLQMAYGGAIFVGASSSFMWSKCITVLGHAILALILWSRAKSVDPTSKAAITAFYMFIWKLFYVEYLLIPLVR